MKHRSYELELLDLGIEYYTENEYQECLHELGRIGKFLGGNRVGLKLFEKLDPPSSILDIGCGGGQFCQILGKKYPDAKILGIDLDSQAITFANQNKPAELDNVTFALQEEKALPFDDNSFDIVTATLVCHHISDNELVVFLQECRRIAKCGVVINDLHRNWLPYFFFRVIAPLFFPNRLIVHDGLLSIKRGFKKRDWQKYIDLPRSQVDISWYFPFRWGVVIKCTK